MITGLEPIAIKWAIGHVSHALAAKEAMVVQHPLYTATNMAVNHGIASAVTSILTNPAVPAATTLSYVHVPVVSGAVLSHGAAGTAAASSTPVAAWHTVAKLAEPVGAGVAAYLIHKSELYQRAKDALSELLNEVKDVEDLDDLKDLVSGLAILARIRNQSA